MFTGIVEHRGKVAALDGTRLRVEAGPVAEDAEPGDSVAVSGACLTVVGRDEGTLAFDLAPETLKRTTLGELVTGEPVNLERPLTLLTALGGHLVQGHVDGVSEVKAVDPSGDGTAMVIRLPEELSRYVVEKGSIAVDGVSLTVAELWEDAFEVALVPHTLGATTLGEREAGSKVNLEVDMLAKYLERMTRR